MFVLDVFKNCIFRIVVLAGDVTPIDVYSHLPVMCEDRNVPYCYVPSKMVRVRVSLCCSHSELPL